MKCATALVGAHLCVRIESTMKSPGPGFGTVLPAVWTMCSGQFDRFRERCYEGLTLTILMRLGCVSVSVLTVVQALLIAWQ